MSTATRATGSVSAGTGLRLLPEPAFRPARPVGTLDDGPPASSPDPAGPATAPVLPETADQLAQAAQAPAEAGQLAQPAQAPAAEAGQLAVTMTSARILSRINRYVGREADAKDGEIFSAGERYGA
jgi:hypothetical protein